MPPVVKAQAKPVVIEKSEGYQKHPSLLVSFFYLHIFKECRDKYHYRSWVMDSGAFSAMNSGAVIDLKAYIECCKEMLATDPKLIEVFALDVIGDWKATLKNTEEMWKAGVPAIPCFHFKEPWDALRIITRDYPKIAFGGVVGVNVKAKTAWTEQCFARVWPKKVHGFAYGSARDPYPLRYPFHSVDATNWELRPRKFGLYDSFAPGARIPVRGGIRNLRPEIERYINMEAEAREKWASRMLELGCPVDSAPNIRLAAADGMCLAMSGYQTELYQPAIPANGETT